MLRRDRSQPPTDAPFRLPTDMESRNVLKPGALLLALLLSPPAAAFLGCRGGARENVKLRKPHVQPQKGSVSYGASSCIWRRSLRIWSVASSAAGAWFGLVPIGRRLLPMGVMSLLESPLPGLLGVFPV